MVGAARRRVSGVCLDSHPHDLRPRAYLFMACRSGFATGTAYVRLYCMSQCYMVPCGLASLSIPDMPSAKKANRVGRHTQTPCNVPCTLASCLQLARDPCAVHIGIPSRQQARPRRCIIRHPCMGGPSGHLRTPTPSSLARELLRRLDSRFKLRPINLSDTLAHQASVGVKAHQHAAHRLGAG